MNGFGLQTMNPQFDIFRVHNDGTTIWLEPANTLDAAHARIQQLGASEPGDYLIFNQKTAKKIPLKVGQG
jgi:hypothetical protein